MRKPLKIVLWSIVSLILLLLIVVEGVLLVQKYVKKSPAPMFMGYAPLIVTTGSMNGTIDQGDMVIIKKTNDYRLGDIVAYLEKGGSIPVMHRLINFGPEEGTFIAKGDANNTADKAPVAKDQIIGEVVYVIPKVGLVIDWFVKGGGIIYVAAMIVVAVVGVYLWKMLKPEPEDEAEDAEAETEAESAEAEGTEATSNAESAEAPPKSNPGEGAQEQSQD